MKYIKNAVSLFVPFAGSWYEKNVGPISLPVETIYEGFELWVTAPSYYRGQEKSCDSSNYLKRTLWWLKNEILRKEVDTTFPIFTAIVFSHLKPGTWIGSKIMS